uniref:Xrn1 N-terminal domain-containing protein n=1 Tax=Compsopogon caeruleus TaxID=31354 RepID=A0A7S1XEB9_9RHOD|mmetsp:Transcript_4864/g.9835  ORF Transcript_4864/g.9835 Transcript_4864/m.9835 type:complete len:576 (+) Transcript_4864:273-2000(+)
MGLISACASSGPGPMAKLLTQRVRRSNPANSQRKVLANRHIDPNAITPGTELMYMLQDALDYFACSRLEGDMKYDKVDMRISGPDVPGEGEVKIFDWLNSFVARREAGTQVSSIVTESVIVIGGDADIVLQGLATTSFRDLFVYAQSRRDEGTVISISLLVKALEDNFPGESDRVRLDFIVLCLMNGNDYLPKVRGVGFDSLWNGYIAIKKGREQFQGQYLLDSTRRTFNWPFLVALLETIRSVVIEPHVLLAEKSLQVEEPSRMNEEEHDVPPDPNEIILYTGDMTASASTSAAIPDVDDDEEDHADDEIDDESVGDDGEYDYESAYDETNTGESPNRLFDIELFLRGILWNVQMYVDGFCPDYTYVYPELYAPSPTAIMNWVKAHDGDPLFSIQGPLSTVQPLEPHKAAIAMLPSSASHLLPGPIQELGASCTALDRARRDSMYLRELSKVLDAVDSIPRSLYTRAELRRTRFGNVHLIRKTSRPRAASQLPPPPVARFRSLRVPSHLNRMLVTTTTAPPCLRWTSASQVISRGSQPGKRAFSKYNSRPSAPQTRIPQTTKPLRNVEDGGRTK